MADNRKRSPVGIEPVIPKNGVHPNLMANIVSVRPDRSPVFSGTSVGISLKLSCCSLDYRVCVFAEVLL